MSVGKAGMLADEFKRLRVESGLTQEQAGPVLGVVARTVARWEQGSTQIGMLQAAEIRRLLVRRARGVAQTKRS